MIPLALRWTVGDVSSRGWEALRLSVHCARILFGSQASYTICCNTVPLARAQRNAGQLPAETRWRVVTAADMPAVLQPHLDRTMAEGVGWKLLPLHLDPTRHELALDNDCVLWARPAALDRWIGSAVDTLLSADVERSLGMFQQHGKLPAINSGIRGLPPYFPYDEELRAVLATVRQPVTLHSELDEQGLQAAALHHSRPALLISTEEVSICSPFHPRQPELGSCGAHFVALNVRHIPWNYFDRSATEVRQEHYDRHRPALFNHARLPLPALPEREAD